MHNDTVERNFKMVEQVIHQLQTWKAEVGPRLVAMEERIAHQDAEINDLKMKNILQSVTRGSTSGDHD